ncbi:class I SAM-dependent methyltransferase [Lutimonas halocynthiae]|uniref:class I SAM-dependent methyltransferase n=1 Tax=Lutimonas halocynthiae TaxID=1446477 RepID=UPI0025B56C8F|nr:class I SAM-dependent methyltransferase [Lutimonas halocynthiae]MDN3641747.1 class I SAM-dependent methyltransferase [Lutimonas halocynthiae]
MNKNCPLCGQESNTFFQDPLHHFFVCDQCEGIFRDRDQFLSKTEEKKRYLHHISSMEDTGYYQFVSPIINEVTSLFPIGSLGLDFGCGHTPVLSRHLSNEGFNMVEYDPIFFDDKPALKAKYNFIVTCEVVEHFYNPFDEFKRLYDLLKPEGRLICKTHPFEKEIDFASWYYKNDPSHVFIYQRKTFEWIQDFFGFKNVKINDRTITFSKY